MYIWAAVRSSYVRTLLRSSAKEPRTPSLSEIYFENTLPLLPHQKRSAKIASVIRIIIINIITVMSLARHVSQSVRSNCPGFV